MKSIKKFTSVILTIVMILGVVAVAPFSVNSLTQSEFNSRVAIQKSTYPNGSVCYSTQFGQSCFGWAYLIGYNIFGTSPSNWTKIYSLSSVQAGDIIQYGNTTGSGHTVFVVSVSGNTITFADCNGNGNRNLDSEYVAGLCMVKWDNTITISANALFGYSFSYLLRSPSNAHTHDYNTYVYYWKAHPHYNCYQCNCGEITHNTAETRLISTCADCLAEYKPIGSISKSVYLLNENIIVKWDKINNATHYNVRLYKTDNNGNSSLYSANYNITDTSYTFSSLSAGNYYLYIQTYNKNYWTVDGSDYFYSQGDKISFSVVDKYTSVVSEIADYNGHTYMYFDNPVSWIQAYKTCERMGGHLVTISSQEENDFVLDLASKYQNQRCWLGGTDFNNNLSWYWVNSEPFSYSNWNTNEPNNDGGAEYCINMWVNNDYAGTWNDSPYNVSGAFICEFDNTINADLYTPTKTVIKDNVQYDIYDISVDWQTAKRICEEKGGHLVTIDNATENAYIQSITADTACSEYWIGLNDLVTEGEWHWSDYTETNYTNWLDGQPDSDWGVEDYALIIKSSGLWGDLKGFAYAYHSIGFICETDLGITGDIDKDDIVDITDATELQKYLADITTLTDNQLYLADTNGNGSVDIQDVTTIQKYLAGAIDYFPRDIDTSASESDSSRQHTG